MRWYLGYPVLAAGLAFAANTFLPGESDLLSGPDTLSRDAAVRTAPAVVTASEVRAEPRSRLAAFSPGALLLKAKLPPAPTRITMLDYIAQTFAAAEPTPPAPAPAVVEPVTAASWKSAVIPVAVATESAKSERTDAAERAALLARDVQRELQRVGCYLGEIDGIWGPGSQRAVLAFMDRVNAALPVEEPDVFMLSLLVAQDTPVCGATCPQGQSLTAAGRCLPTTLLAQAGRQTDTSRLHVTQAQVPLPLDDTPEPAAASEPDAAWETVVAEAPAIRSARPVPLHGRMGIGGPRPEDQEVVPTGRASRTAVLPITAEPLQRTAALEPIAIEAGDGASDGTAGGRYVDDIPVVRDVTVAPRPRAKAPPVARARPEKPTRIRGAWRSNYRQVQRLFEHPLGRM